MQKKTIRHTPQKLPAWILRHMLLDDVWHTPLGDFEEYFNSIASEKGVFRAQLWYWRQILQILPFKAIHSLYWSINMFKNYLKMAIRTIKRNKGYTFINVAGLAIGITSCLLIILFVQHELNYDTFHEKAENIHRVGMRAMIGTNRFSVSNVPSPLAGTIVNDFPEVIQATRFFQTRQIFLQYENQQFKEENFYFADPNIFDVFTIPLKEGNPQSALEQPNSIILTEKMALKYFGENTAMGKVLLAENGTPYTVTGITPGLPSNSHFHFDFLASSKNYSRSQEQDWFTNAAFTYIVLDNNADPAQLAAKLPDFSKKYVGPILEAAMGIPFDKLEETGHYFGFFLQPLLDIHLHSNLDNELEAKGSVNTVIIFSAIAIFILLVACINFTNLATARAAKRANEVGVRKVIGSQKRQLVQQFLTESFFLCTLAFLIALGLLRLSLPVFNQIVGKEIQLDLWGNWFMIPGIVGLAIIIGFISGSYPAFLLASFRPVIVLKGKMQAGSKDRRFRNILVVFQYITTVSLFIGTIVIFSQLHYIRNKDLGYNKEHVVIINNAMQIGEAQQAFKTELLQNPYIVNATYSNGLPQMRLSGQVFQKEGQEGENTYILVNLGTDYDYFDTYRMEMLEGRFFSRDISTDSTAVILNEAALKALEIENPLEKQIFLLADERIPLNIIGIIKDFHLQSLHQTIRPSILTLDQSAPLAFLSIRIQPGRIEDSLRFIESQWSTFVSEQPVDFVFFDERFDRLYRSEIRTSRVFTAFAFLAILIASLGLFGLASFMAEQRTKEIGIRKVLGASVSGVVLLLSKEYIKWILIANIVAWPLAYYFMNKWLQNFAFRTGLNLWMFLASGIAALIIALTTVSYQSLKAALSHPAKCLRYE